MTTLPPLHPTRYKYSIIGSKGHWYPLYFDNEEAAKGEWHWNYYHEQDEVLGPEQEPTSISFTTMDEAEQFINDPHNRFPEE